MERDRRADDIEEVAQRLAQLELTLLEVVTALGMLVGELALRDDLVLTTPSAVEDALEHGWQALVGVPESGPLRIDDEWADPTRLAATAPSALPAAMAELGASVGAIYTVGDDAAELVAHAGYPEGVMERYRVLPLDADLPVAAAARSRQAIWFGERREILETYPHLAEAHAETEAAIGDTGQQGAVVPLLAGDRVAAVVLVGFSLRAASPDPTRLQAVRERIVQALGAR